MMKMTITSIEILGLNCDKEGAIWDAAWRMEFEGCSDIEPVGLNLMGAGSMDNVGDCIEYAPVDIGPKHRLTKKDRKLIR